MKIKEILCEQELNPENKKSYRYSNKKLIEKIYEEKKETNVIKILELTFEELFIIYRRKLNNSEDIKKIEEIKDKIIGLDLLEENNKYKDIEYLIKELEKKHEEEYIKEVIKACLEYENLLIKKKKNKNKK